MNNNLYIQKKIKERLHPRIWQWDYLGLKPLLLNLQSFSEQIKDQSINRALDLGCGVKPYRNIFSFIPEFVGFDIEKNERVDVVGVNWDLPFKTNEFDAIISTQVLEHTAKIPETVSEMQRVVKSGGFIFISVPLAFPEHGAPHDYYRFTRYGLEEVFKDFEILEIKAHNGYLNTLLRLLNAFLANFPFSKYLFLPIFLINNVIAISLDRIAFCFSRSNISYFMNFYNNTYMSFTESYTIILKNKK